MNPLRTFLILLTLCLSLRAAEVRIGLIGLDTSHVTAFTRLLNDSSDKDHVPGGRIVAAFKGGSPDVEASRSRVDGFTQELQERYGVELCDTISELCTKVDAVMIESVDGRPHLAQAVPVILAGKPLFIDKPMAASLEDVVAIFQLAEARGVPIFSASSLRFGKSTQSVRAGVVGRVSHAETTSPCSVEPHHPELFWYGIHGVESLFTVMGTGCQSVQRSLTDDGRIQVTGTWAGGRSGIYREAKEYGGIARGSKGELPVGSYDGYAPLLTEVVGFFQTGQVPVPPAETIELFAFLEAAAESARRDGAPVRLNEVFQRVGYERPPILTLLETRRIWDNAPHNAFTDLIRYKDQWVCVFREGQGHVSDDGAIRVITSTDSVNWTSAARLTSDTADLRDPKLCITPSGQLMLSTAGAIHQPAAHRHQSYAWFAADAREWGDPIPIGEPDWWLWRITWHRGNAYAVGYHTVDPRQTRLYRSRDGRAFEVLVSELRSDGYPNEGTLRFSDDDRSLLLLRRDADSATAQLGHSVPPYDRWEWSDLKVRVGGPDLLQLPDDRWLAGVRVYDGGARTVLAWLDPDNASLTECLALPSGGDTSYPGLAWHDGLLWMSYYSSHEEKSSIYLAKIAADPTSTAATEPSTSRSVQRIGNSLRESFGLDPFYQKHLPVGGFPIVGSAQVSDDALREAGWIVSHLLRHRADILDAMADQGVRLAVMAHNEYTTDIPEHRHLEPAVFWDRRARGLGATPSAPAVSCAEENLLCYPNDPYSTENILIHEFAHAIHAMGLNRVDPTFDPRLQSAYTQARANGLWEGTYAGTNHEEYWAEAVQSWFDDNRQNDALHNHVNTRQELRDYDPDLAGLVEEVFGDIPWRYLKPEKRPTEDRRHLLSSDSAPKPRFEWRHHPVTDKPRVLIQTKLGDVEVELDAARAPVTTRNFLHYVLEGYYSDGLFHRTVTPSNQPTNNVRIEVVQASANPERQDEFPPPIPLERTRDTGLRHTDGTISMARSTPDSSQDHFFICIGDQPELDFGGKRNPDGQGFAAFGRVVKGMDVVRKIQTAPAEGQALTPPIGIQRAVRRH